MSDRRPLLNFCKAPKPQYLA